MIGRFFLGAGLGGLVGTGLLALASLTTPNRPQMPASPQAEAIPAPAAVTPEAAPEAAAVAATPAVPAAADLSAETPPPAAPVPAAVPETATVEAPATQAPAAAAPEVSAASPPPDADVAAEVTAVEPAAPAAFETAPEAASEPPAMPAAIAPEDPAVAPAPTDPAAPGVAATVPELPAAPPAPVAETAPMTPEMPAAAPDLATAKAPAAPAAPPVAAETPATLPQTAEPAEIAQSRQTPQTPQAPLADAAPPAPDLPAPPPLTPEEEALLAGMAPPATGEAPDAAPDAVPEAVPGTEPDANPEAAPEAAPAAPVEPAPPVAPTLPGEGVVKDDPTRRIAVGNDGQSTLPSAPSLGGGNGGVATDRLPRVGDADAVAEDAAPETGTPLLDHARAFDNPNGKPVLALILIDTGEPALDRAALAALPFPVSFALDPMAEGAADRAATYRAAGQEVIMLATALPKGAAASDVEQAFQVMAQNLPEAVAVMDLPERLFQGNRGLSSAVVPVVAGQGRGIVTWDEGLNAADQVARREDVPAAVVFRSLDAEGEATPVIRRYLDRAAFKAAQEGRVAVVGHTRPETVAALLEWAFEGRAATVALAPVSAVLSVD